MSSISGQSHSFDILLAAKYGVEEAILIHHFMHWIRINQMAKRNIKDGRCWTYQSRKEICLHFPYWNFEKIRTLCEKLEMMGVIVTANYNKSKIDKTLWYAFVNEAEFGVDAESSRNFYERENSLSRGKFPTWKGKIPTPIPDTIPDTKPTDVRKEETHPTLSSKESSPVGSSLCAFGKFVKMTKEEHEVLKKTHGEETVNDIIEQINDYLSSSGKKPYKDFAAAVRQWLRRRKDSAPKMKPQSNSQINLSYFKEVRQKYPDTYKHYQMHPHAIENTWKKAHVVLDIPHEEFKANLHRLFGVRL